MVLLKINELRKFFNLKYSKDFSEEIKSYKKDYLKILKVFNKNKTN